MTSSSGAPLHTQAASAGPCMQPVPPSYPPPAPGGLGRVVRKASDFPEAFDMYTSEHCSQVEELPLGTMVLMLPGEPADVGWAPILVASSEADCHTAVRFTWHHPQCIELLKSSDLGGPIVVGHCQGRGSKDPSHSLKSKAQCGVRRMEDQTLLLDARWSDDIPRQRDTDKCSGLCASVCIETASQPRRVAHILEFASKCESGCIVGDYGKHRSLSAAVILNLFFHRTVDDQYAFQDRPNQPCPCGRPAAQNIARISAAFRSLENDTQPCNLLSFILGL